MLDAIYDNIGIVNYNIKILILILQTELCGHTEIILKGVHYWSSKNVFGTKLIISTFMLQLHYRNISINVTTIMNQHDGD
jgi:hypothetical protein